MHLDANRPTCLVILGKLSKPQSCVCVHMCVEVYAHVCGGVHSCVSVHLCGGVLSCVCTHVCRGVHSCVCAHVEARGPTLFASFAEIGSLTG